MLWVGPNDSTIMLLVTAAGIMKMTMPHAWTTSLLAWSMLTFPAGHAKSGQTNAGLEQVKWGSDYLLKTVSINNAGSAIIFQVRMNNAPMTLHLLRCRHQVVVRVLLRLPFCVLQRVGWTLLWCMLGEHGPRLLPGTRRLLG